MKKWIYLLLLVFLVPYLTGCKKDKVEEEEVEMAFVNDVSNTDYSLENTGTYNNLAGIPDNWGPVVPFSFNTDVNVDLDSWENVLDNPGADVAVMTVIKIVDFVVSTTSLILKSVRLDQERRVLSHLNKAEVLIDSLNTVHLPNLMRSLEDLNNSVNCYLDSVQMATEDLMIEQEVLSQYRRINRIMEIVNKQQILMREFVNVDFVYYHDAINLILVHQSDSVREHISYEDEYAYYRTIYSMLGDWAGPGNKRIIDILSLGDQMCGTTYTSDQGVLTGMPALYDQLMRDLKPWEHEAVESAANLRVPDLEVYFECILLASEYLAACDALQEKAHGVDPMELLTALETSANRVFAAYKPPTYNDQIRVCNIAGAHLVFRETTIHPVNYNTLRWVPNKYFVFDPAYIAYGFTGDVLNVMEHQITERQAERILRYYKDKNKQGSLLRILVEDGNMDYPELQLDDVQLLLSGIPTKKGADKQGNFYLYVPAAGTEVAPVSIARYQLDEGIYFNRDKDYKVSQFCYVNVQ